MQFSAIKIKSTMEKDYMRELVKKVAEIVEDFMTKTKY